MFVMIYIFALVISYMVIYGFSMKNDSITISKLRILLISLVFALYSVSLGNEILVDRKTYHFQFTEYFPKYIHTWSSILDSNIEPGFILLTHAIHWFTNDSYWLFFIISFVTVLIDLYVINKLADSNNKKVILFYLISLQIFFGTYLCRQIIAASLINLSFLFFIKNRNILAIVFIIVASLFHTTALIMLPIYIFIYVLYKRQLLNRISTIVIVILLFVVGYFLYEPIISMIMGNQTLQQYLGDLNYSDDNKNYTIILKGLPFHLIAIYAIIERKKIARIMGKSDVYIITVLINSMCWIMASQMYWLYRLALYGAVPSLILIPLILQACDSKRKAAFYKYSILGSMLLITLREIAITMY